MNKVEKSDDVVSNDTISNQLEISRHGDSHIEETLKEAAGNYPSIIRTISPQWESEIERAFIAGAQWQKKHLEMNRIKHCDNITEEQYNLETDFLDDFIDKHDRIPTFLDAIEHGMNLQKEQDQSTIELAEDHAYLAGQEKIIEKACEWIGYNNKNGGCLFDGWEDNFRKAMEE